MNLKQPLHPKTVLAVAAHPDDLEYGLAGSIALWAAEGADIYYLILTDGCNGTSDRTAVPKEVCNMRRSEQDKAAKILGVKKVFYCDYPDGELMNTPEVRKDIVRVIRQTKPEVVLCMDPSMYYTRATGMINHADHRASGEAALDAVYPHARDHLSFPDLLEREKLEPHKVQTVLLINFETHNFSIDIDEVILKKLEALKAHVSQSSSYTKDLRALQDHPEFNGKKIHRHYKEEFIRLNLPL